MNITRKHDKSQSDIRIQLQRVADSMARDLNVKYEWKGADVLRFKGTGISGSILLDEAGQQLEIDLQKSFFLPISDEALRNKVNAYLDEQL